ncbi:putative transposase/invertase (TIGR01784 family) [Pullulanibacillus pueri]|uniref:PD-(D/E)XK nuclease transposase family protein n=1 Tax=Pullulanibacillus pueri TaxID=1437324 RepID=A0A8J2ZTK9_9BACL|nr:hypothetical protein [Pullulanibacillus pueri]MBM7684134.1 putative transposase/invertase (TIGR01784 family) [Pullulanibacillus pueri]GGH76736.1 hypothetical protein GCM10007096_07610 [Pullulanibacillus pueri]
MEDETLRGAFKDWEKLSASKEKQLAYEARVKEVMDAYSAKREAKLYAEEQLEKGIKIGEEKGKREITLSIAKKLIQKGNDTETILELTDLTG